MCDEILALQKAKEREKDMRFVDLGRYPFSYHVWRVSSSVHTICESAKIVSL